MPLFGCGVFVPCEADHLTAAIYPNDAGLRNEILGVLKVRCIDRPVPARFENKPERSLVSRIAHSCDVAAQPVLLWQLRHVTDYSPGARVSAVSDNLSPIVHPIDI